MGGYEGKKKFVYLNVSHCVTRFRTRLTLTTCQIRYYSHCGIIVPPHPLSIPPPGGGNRHLAHGQYEIGVWCPPPRGWGEPSSRGGGGGHRTALNLDSERLSRVL